MEYQPDEWAVIKIPYKTETIYKVFGSWDSSYLEGERWRMNNGIDEVKEDEKFFYFYGYSASCYKCEKTKFGIRNTHSRNVLDNLISDVKTKIDVDIELITSEVFDEICIIIDNNE